MACAGRQELWIPKTGTASTLVEEKEELERSEPDESKPREHVQGIIKAQEKLHKEPVTC